MTNNLSSSSDQTPLILIVDDDRSMRSLLNLAMEEEGYRVVEANSGELALAEYVRLKPDLLLLDAVMPDLDGFSCCDRLRQLPEGDLVPVLIITVLDDQESIDRAFAVGATDYITKPLHWGVLAQRVRRLLTTSQARSATTVVQEHLKQQQAWEQLLRNTLQNLWQSLNLGDTFSEILPEILTECRHFLGVEGMVLFEQENKHFIESVLPGSPSVKNLKKSLENLSLGTEYPSEKTIVLDPFDQDKVSPAIASQLTKLNLKALAIAPITIGDQLWGWLCAYHAQNSHQWQESECNRLTDIAKLLSVATK